MKNMKIEINEIQSVEDVVWELERLGFKKSETVGAIKGVNIYADRLNNHWFEDGRNFLYYQLTTLSDLRKMERVG